MKTTASLLWALSTLASAGPTVDNRFPYKGPSVPVGDWADQSINGNGNGFSRLVEPPAVKPSSSNPTNNVNVISLSYIPDGIHIHYQTPFGLGKSPSVKWGSDSNKLDQIAKGYTHSYDRTPSCSQFKAVTQCSQFFHEVSVGNLKSGKTYYYQIQSANGTTESEVLSFKTALKAGDPTKFTVAVLNDMGYTNAQGTHKYLSKAASDDAAFAWHGGDLSYADNWGSGVLPCADEWPVCYNGTSTEPRDVPLPTDYKKPMPSGVAANRGSPRGGDMSSLYESNWDLWQQWMGNVTKKIPYMVLPGNHEASCVEGDGPTNPLTAYLNKDEKNSTASKPGLTYYSCPPSQRNFTAFQHRYRMPGNESNGVGNFWYSFDYGLAHFISLDGETDHANSPSKSFADDVKGDEKLPKESETKPIDSGPFGSVKGSVKDNKAYEQYKWLKDDLASVNRTKTPWVIAMSHRPMYSSHSTDAQTNTRDAFEALMLQYKVDAYLAGHIHWYERLFPMGKNGALDMDSVVNNNTYVTNPGKSMTHLINGAAGNVESFTPWTKKDHLKNITAVLNREDFGFSKLTVVNSTALKWDYVLGTNGSEGDSLWLLKSSGSKQARQPRAIAVDGLAA